MSQLINPALPGISLVVTIILKPAHAI